VERAAWLRRALPSGELLRRMAAASGAADDHGGAGLEPGREALALVRLLSTRGRDPGLLTFSTTIQPPDSHHTAAIRSTKDGPPSSGAEKRALAVGLRHGLATARSEAAAYTDWLQEQLHNG
jgi:hypothetical protein